MTINKNCGEIITARNLETKEARRKLGKFLKRFGGRAHVIVHPFYEYEEKLPEEYLESLKNLLCRSGNNPIIVFEDKARVAETERKFQAWGVKKSIFLVETGRASAIPLNESMLAALARLGLKQAVISGRMYMKNYKPELTLELSKLRQENVAKKIMRLEGMKTPRNAKTLERYAKLVRKDLEQYHRGCIGQLYYLLIKQGVIVSLHPKLAQEATGADLNEPKSFWDLYSEE
ncbi:hypothetical protein HY991_01885 [Candidatus Micrarchaeota archaeon]|nr:hypothetical protein [Candidatus Micrarchaeota archaeon]